MPGLIDTKPPQSRPVLRQLRPVCRHRINDPSPPPFDGNALLTPLPVV
jgi:hypothetical protein